MSSYKDCMPIIRIFIAAVLFFFCTKISAQQPKDSVSACPVKSIPDLLKKKNSDFTVKPLKTNFLLVIPLIASQPATGFVFGAIGQYTFKEKREGARYSTATLSANYTTKKQVLINAKNTL